MDSEKHEDNGAGRDLRPSSSGVSGWLRGDNVPNANSLRLIIKVLKCDFDDLYEDDKFSARRLNEQLEFKGLSPRDFADNLLFAAKGIEF